MHRMKTTTTLGDAAALVEATARVVAFDRGVAVLEPEPGTSCGSCAAASTCGAKGIGSAASRLEGRRFRLDLPGDLAIGEQVVVGVRDDALVKAAFVAYGIPLLTLLTAGVVADAAALGDALVLAASLAGFAGGLGLARLLAHRLNRRSDMAPRYLRRAESASASACHPQGIAQ
jgi:sigma-E factor negative regulatory protein RseC